MKKFQENYLSMFKTVDTAIEPYASDIDAIPPLQSARQLFKDVISNIGIALQKQSINVTGQTDEKNLRRQKMCDQAFLFGQLISAYALANNKLALDAEVNYSITYFNRLRDEEVAEVCRTIFQKAKDNLSDLGDYGITLPKINDLGALIADYTANTQLNTVSWQQKQAQTQTISNQINIGKTILKNSFDKLMLIFLNTNPELYNAYTIARNSMPTRHAKKSNGDTTDEEAGILTGTVTDSDENIPIQGATVKLTATDFECETDEDGIYLFDTLPAGTYTIEVSLLDYVTATLPNQKVIAGDETTADFKMMKSV